MAYRERLNRHLENYRVNRLGISETGSYRHRNEDIPYAHILPLRLKHLNLLEGVRNDVLRHVEENDLRLHRYFHHLNSSQAFAFNLFFPYFWQRPESAPVLLRALGQDGSFAKARFEAVPVPDEGTNIDVLWSDSDEKQTLCEVKLSEAEIGTARSDAEHLAKLTETYLPSLSPHFSADDLDPSKFFRSYQYYRNVWHMLRVPKARLVFLLPRQNERVWRKLESLRARTAASVSERISIIAIEDVLTRLMSEGSSPRQLQEHAVALAEKYLPTQADIA